MNTYQVTYFPPNGVTPSAVALTVQAKDFTYGPADVTFWGSTGAAVLSVPVALDPVVQMTGGAL